jgi:hypothetical protein
MKLTSLSISVALVVCCVEAAHPIREDLVESIKQKAVSWKPREV